MKNRISQTIGLVLALLACCGTTTFAQVAGQIKFGTASGQVGTITDLNAAKEYLSRGFESPAYLSDVKLEYSEYDSKFYLTGRVNNHLVGGIAIQVEVVNGGVYSAIGPVLEVTCMGYNCAECRPIVSKLRPKCKCFESTGPDTRCDMMSKIGIGG